MAEALENRSATGERYYTTSYALGTGTTSTMALRIWHEMSTHLTKHGAPVSGSQLVESTGVTQERLDQIFDQEYYRKHYGFRRFERMEEWRAWAESGGVVYVPELHDPKPTEEPDLGDEEDEVSDDEDA